MPFKTVVRLTACLFAGLSLGLLVAPGFFLQTFGLDPSVGAEVLARRSGMIFAGLTPLYLALSTATDGQLQRAIAQSTLFLMVGLVALGLVEWALGRVGTGIMVAVGAELVFAALYAPLVWRKRS